MEHGHLLVPRTEVLATLNALRFLLLSERSLLEVGYYALDCDWMWALDFDWMSALDFGWM